MNKNVELVATGVRVVDVRLYHGDITVRSTDRDAGELAWSSDRNEAPELERDGDVIHIRQRGEPVNPPRLNLNLVIPAGVEVVTLRTGKGRISGDGVRGHLTFESDNGDLALRTARGTVVLQATHGAVRVVDVDGELQVTGGNGDILLQGAGGRAALTINHGRVEVTAPQALDLTVQSSHGDIQIGEGSLQRAQVHTNAGSVRCAADLSEGQHRLASGHGDVTVRAARGKVELATVSGRIGVQDVRGHLRAHAGHGDVILEAATGVAVLETDSGRIEVKVPREVRLQAVSGNGDIHVGDGTVQTLQAETRRGTISCLATLVPDVHTATNGHGDVKLRSVHGKSSVTTGAGKIEIQEATGTLRASTGNGDVVVRGATGEADLQTTHGRIDVGAPRALALRAASGDGDVRIGDGSLLALQAKTRTGRVECRADLGAGRAELTSGNGDVALTLRADTRARLDAQTGFGQVHTDFALVRVGRSGSMSFNGMRMVGSLGVGEPELEIVLRTERGQVEIRRKEAAAARYDLPPARAAGLEPDPGYTLSGGPPASDEGLANQQQLDVLQALARGEISPDEADILLQGIA